MAQRLRRPAKYRVSIARMSGPSTSSCGVTDGPSDPVHDRVSLVREREGFLFSRDSGEGELQRLDYLWAAQHKRRASAGDRSIHREQHISEGLLL